MLHPKLLQLVKTVSPGQDAQILNVNDQPLIVRVTNETAVPAKPLSEATSQIQRLLAPVQIKKAIEQAGKEALTKVGVEYK